MKYTKNLHIDGDHVISYTTHVATIDREARKLYRHGWWSMTTSKHVNHVAQEYGLTIEDRIQSDRVVPMIGNAYNDTITTRYNRMTA